jgi:hypothetical protein
VTRGWTPTGRRQVERDLAAGRPGAGGDAAVLGAGGTIAGGESAGAAAAAETGAGIAGSGSTTKDGWLSRTAARQAEATGRTRTAPRATGATGTSSWSQDSSIGAGRCRGPGANGAGHRLAARDTLLRSTRSMEACLATGSSGPGPRAPAPPDRD